MEMGRKVASGGNGRRRVRTFAVEERGDVLLPRQAREGAHSGEDVEGARGRHVCDAVRHVLAPCAETRKNGR